VGLVIAFTQADAVEWLCFLFGAVLLSVGVAIGLWTSLYQAVPKAC
jgi:hypothetical protein